MNIKSLLLGSAAALVAVSGVQAADAVVVAEPEPAEYVRICDVYGAGYFYIPGTETCLRIGGSLRYTMGFGDFGAQDLLDKGDGLSTHDSWASTAEFRFNINTGQETELGTLSTFVQARFNWGSGGLNNINVGGLPGTGINVHGEKGAQLYFGWMQLGGLRIGVDESLFSTFPGYAGNVINDTLVGYGPFRTGLISYTFDAGNGFSIAASLEHGDDSFSLGGGPSFTSIDSYVPHVVLGARYQQGWGAITGVVARDSNNEEWSAKVRLDVNATEQLSLWIMGGYGSDDGSPTGYSDYFKTWGENWAVWGGGTYNINEKLSLNAQLSYDEAKTFGVAANFDYQPVLGLHVIPEVNYVDADGDDSIGGFIRFQRDF